MYVPVYLRVRGKANWLPRTLASPRPIRGNGLEIMLARLWESARNNCGVAKIRTGRKMRGGEKGNEREVGKRNRKRERERTRGLYASTKWVMALRQIYQLLHFRRRLGRVSLVGFLGYGRPRLVNRRSLDGARSFRRWFTYFSGVHWAWVMLRKRAARLRRNYACFHRWPRIHSCSTSALCFACNIKPK